MYETAETNAKTIGETSRARRYNRAIKTLKDLLKQAKAGKPIPEDEIPPEVATNIHKPQDPPSDDTVASPSRPAPAIPEPTTSPIESETEVPLSSENAELLQMLNKRKDEYKAAALQAKRINDKTTAMNYIKIAKQFETVIAAVENGQPVDLSRMPGPPQESTPKTQENETQKEDSSSNPSPPTAEKPIVEGEATPDVAAGSLEEALQQRIEFYKKQADAATAEGNTSKARRMGRVLKQFEDALKLHKKGKPIPVDELPVTPGFAPIPLDGNAKVTTPVKPEGGSGHAQPSVSSGEGRTQSGESPGTSRVSGKVKTAVRYCFLLLYKKAKKWV